MLKLLSALQRHYDKLLHVSITFMGIAWLAKWLPLYICVPVMLAAQVFKTWANYRADREYKPYGDWAANLSGYALVGIYLGI